jgi:hypothetical protein
MVRVTGLTRKGAIKRFRRMQTRHPLATDARGRPVYYTKDVSLALHEVWTIGGSVCGSNLHPPICEFIDNEIQRDLYTSEHRFTTCLTAKF